MDNLNYRGETLTVGEDCWLTDTKVLKINSNETPTITLTLYYGKYRQYSIKGTISFKSFSLLDKAVTRLTNYLNKEKKGVFVHGCTTYCDNITL